MHRLVLKQARTYLLSLSSMGLVFGAVLMAASLTPSMIPRSALLQGALSGLSFAAGYGAGAGIRAIWHYLEFAQPGAAWLWLFKRLAAVLCLALVFFALWQASDWQNSIRAVMEMEPVNSARPVLVGLIALVVGLVILLIARFFNLAFRLFARVLNRLVPRRVSRWLRRPAK